MIILSLLLKQNLIIQRIQSIQIVQKPESPDDPEGPEPWWPIKEEHQEANSDLV